VLTSNDKGNIAEMAIALEATKLGIEVLKPVAEHVRYDLAFDLGDQIVRVQCKWARLEGGAVCVNLVGYRLTSRGSIRSSTPPKKSTPLRLIAKRWTAFTSFPHTR
jgi:hypothetical protein